MFYEVVYETGQHSIAFYEDDDEASRALTAHHERAKTGRVGGPDGTDWPASRIAAVYVYEYHPADFGAGQEVTPKLINEAMSDAIKANVKDGTVQVHEVAAAVRNMSNPTIPDKKHAFDSNYRAPEARKLKSIVWGE